MAGSTVMVFAVNKAKVKLLKFTQHLTYNLLLSFQIIKEIAKEMFLEVISEICQEIGTGYLQECQRIAMSLHFTKILVPEVADEMTKKIARETLEEEERAKQEAEARRKALIAAENQASKERASSTLIDEIVLSTLDSLVQEIAEQEFRYSLFFIVLHCDLLA